MIVTLSRQTDGRMLVVRVRLQAATVPIIVFAGAGATVAGSATDPGNVAGVIETVEPGKLQLRTERDTQVFDLSGNVRVTRFTAAALTDLRPNQRIAVDGERLIDGLLAAYAVHARSNSADRRCPRSSLPAPSSNATVRRASRSRQLLAHRTAAPRPALVYPPHPSSAAASRRATVRGGLPRAYPGRSMPVGVRLRNNRRAARGATACGEGVWRCAQGRGV
ncbi:MAG: hypothetical protein U0531_06260 [Dehalococcoidia bacterium]